jgi:2-methylcitrate dehydratase PrpD
VAEDRDLPAARIPEALAVGFELEARLADATYPAFTDREWHGTGIYGGVGAAAAVARLTGLAEDRAAAALGLAATGGAGSMLVFGSMAKSLNLARAAADGTQAALLAERGFTCRPVFAPDGGILRSYAAEVDMRRVTIELGETWAVERDGFKPYPCGVVGHAAIDAVLALRERHPEAAGAPERLELAVSPETIRLMGEPDPGDGLGAKFSVRFAAAAAWAHGRVTLETFDDASVRDPQVRAALAVTSVTVDPSLDQDAARATVTLPDGTRDQAIVDHARGTAARPMIDDDLVAKLRGLVPPGVDGERVLDRLHHLDTISARELALALRATPGRTLE